MEMYEELDWMETQLSDLLELAEYLENAKQTCDDAIRHGMDLYEDIQDALTEAKCRVDADIARIESEIEPLRRKARQAEEQYWDREEE